MKNTARKRRPVFFSFYDHTGIEKRLSEMARKGWLIESISNLYWTYRRIEPRDIHFCVSYYPRASDFDPGPSEDQQNFHNLCAHTGWQLACTWHQMQVFYNEKEHPIPLDTDPVMEVDTLHRACNKNFLPSYYILLALSLIMTVYFVARVFHDPVGLLSSASSLVTELAYVCVFLIYVVELTAYFTWHAKAKAAAGDGIFVDTPSTVAFQKGIMVFLLVILVWWFANLFAGDDPLMVWVAAVMLCGMAAILLLVNGVKQGLKKAKASRGLNRFLTLAACFLFPTILIAAVTYPVLSGIYDPTRAPGSRDEIPLSVADLRDVDEENYIRQNRRNETFLVGQLHVDMFGDWNVEGSHDLPDIRYTVTTVKVPFLYDICADQAYRNRDERNNDIPEGHRNVYRQTDPEPWGADRAYRVWHEEGWWRNIYLLCYDDRIIEIDLDWEPTPEDIAVIVEKLVS